MAINKYDDTFTTIASEALSCANENGDIHDSNGNITQLPHLKKMIWDEKNQLVQVQLNEDDTPNMAYYQYDAAGQRVRKQVHKNNGTIIEERIYLGGFEIYRRRNGYNGTDLTLERQTLHVMDDKQRIALVETRTAGTDIDDSRMRRFRYQLNNHLGSSTMEIEWAQDQNNGQWQAEILSYEESYAYGGTAYIAGRKNNGDITPEVKRKRYRYSGKERDDETGMYYYGARYYAPWMGRWVSCDPLGILEGKNLYKYLKNNPIMFVDLLGMQSENITEDAPLYRSSTNTHVPFELSYLGNHSTNSYIDIPTIPENIKKGFEQIKAWVNDEPLPETSSARAMVTNPNSEEYNRKVQYAINYFIMKGISIYTDDETGKLKEKITRNDIIQAALRSCILVRGGNSKNNDFPGASESLILRDAERYLWGRAGIEYATSKFPGDIIIENLAPYVSDFYDFMKKSSMIFSIDTLMRVNEERPHSRPGGGRWFDLGLKHYWSIDRPIINSTLVPNLLENRQSKKKIRENDSIEILKP